MRPLLPDAIDTAAQSAEAEIAADPSKKTDRQVKGDETIAGLEQAPQPNPGAPDSTPPADNAHQAQPDAEASDTAPQQARRKRGNQPINDDEAVRRGLELWRTRKARSYRAAAGMVFDEMPEAERNEQRTTFVERVRVKMGQASKLC